MTVEKRSLKKRGLGIYSQTDCGWRSNERCSNRTARIEVTPRQGSNL